MSQKKAFIIFLSGFLAVVLAIFVLWVFGIDRKLDRAETLLEEGKTKEALAVLEPLSDSNSENELYRLIVLFNRAGAIEKAKAPLKKLVKKAPDASRTYAARLLVDWAENGGQKESIYAEADEKGLDLSAYVPNAPATKHRGDVTLAPLSEVEIFPYRKEDAVYLEIDGTTANVSSPRYTLPLVTVFGEYPLSAVSVNEDGVPSRTFAQTLSVTEETTVSFADVTFEAVILGTLGVEMYREVTNRDLRSIETLTLNAMLGEMFFSDEFKSFADLRYFAHLKSLGVSQPAELVDLSPLCGLYGMKQFSLYGPLEDNFNTIASLRALRTLSLERPMMENFAVVKNMPFLTALEVLVGENGDLSELSHLKNLTNLRITYHKISDLTPLSQLENLETLILYENKIKDLTPLSKLPRLKTVDVRKNPIEQGRNLKVETLQMDEVPAV